jgi:hypothetical protein
VPSALWNFQDLFDDLSETTTAGWGNEILQPWLEERQSVLAELRELGRSDSHRVRVPDDGVHYSALEGLYALSRVVDVLLLAFQPDKSDPGISGHPLWRDAIPASSAWPDLCAALGAAPVAESSFHPFFHEIVSVEQSDDADEPPTVIDECWPGAIVGSLLLARAGVAVRAGAHHVDAGVAPNSALYWTWLRRNRRAMDQSHGWGHNSQWRTNFRRDYIADGYLHYNVDADPSAQSNDDLDDADRLDLLRYRCSIRTDLGPDQWPFDNTFVERGQRSSWGVTRPVS